MLKNKLLQKKIAATLATGTLLFASPAFAATDNPLQFYNIVVTADRITQTVAKTPANVTLITNKDIKNKGAKTLAEALTGVSGVTISSYGGLGSKAIPYILGSDRVVLMIDGKRMNLPTGVAGSNGGVDLNQYPISADNIERIEIVKGGSSVLYGADAVGGVINIITKKGTGTTRVNTSVAAGNYGGRSYEISAHGQENKTHWQFSGLQESTDGQRLNSASRDKNFSLRLDQDLSKSEALTLNYDYYGNHAGMPGYETSPTPNDYQDILRHNWGLTYTKEHKDGNRILCYYNNEQTYSGLNYDTYDPTKDPYYYYQNTVKALDYQDSAKIDKNQLLTWGGEWHKDKVVSNKYTSSINDITAKAIFLQNQISTSNKDKLTIGLRNDDNSRFGQHWLPKLAYLHQANKNTSYFANWGKVFKVPRFDDLYGDDGYGDTGNPNLKAETGWTSEIGIKSRLNNNTEATLSLFKREINNAIRWLPIYDYTYHPKNLDQLTSTGINASLVSKLSKVTNIDVGYTYLDSHDENNAGIGDPRHAFHIGLNTRQGKLSQSIYAIFKDKSGYVDPITTYDSRIPSNFIINTNTNYQLDKNTSLFLKINNLFNRQYVSIKYYPANSRNFMFGVKHSI